MEEYLNKGIKEIITRFPKVADVLNAYNIGCVPCNVGTCLLKDIVEIHNLSAADEQILLAGIAKEIYPGREVLIPKLARKIKPGSTGLSYSPPLKRLVDEHVLIKRVLALIPEVIEDLDTETEAGRQLILEAADFIRSYADKFHHAKEEDILFKYFDKDLDIIQAMLQDHEAGRAHARAVREGVDKKDKRAIAWHLKGYGELLSEHIKKEDEILYPWLDRNLSTTQVGELFSKFMEADKKIGAEPVDRQRKFVEKVEEKYRKKETIK